MAFDTLARELFETLPYEKQMEVVDFIMFLSKRPLQEDKKAFPFDVFAGGMTYIAEDFDVTTEGFEEYL